MKYSVFGGTKNYGTSGHSYPPTTNYRRVGSWHTNRADAGIELNEFLADNPDETVFIGDSNQFNPEDYDNPYDLEQI